MISKLITDNRSGKVSTTKFWYNIACTTATFILVWYGYAYKLTWEMFGLYLVGVGSMSSISKFLNLKFQEDQKAGE